jgi:hypothetical protein
LPPTTATNDINITDSDVDGNITRISTGGGDDGITLAGSDFKRLFVVAGDGTNTVDVDDVTAVSLDVTTGTGDDTVNITDSDFTLASSVSTGDGDDTVTVSGSDFLGGLTADGGAHNVGDTFNGLAPGFGNTGLITLLELRVYRRNFYPASVAETATRRIRCRRVSAGAMKYRSKRPTAGMYSLAV